MNRNHIFGFIAAAAVLGLIAFVAWRFFEIIPATRHLPPSREARANEYLALDRWLAGMGHHIRKESSGNLATISRADERQIFIQVSLFTWTGEAVEYLIKWIEDGGHLFLSLDNQYWHDEETLIPLNEFGIEVNLDDSSYVRYDPESPNYDNRVSFELSPDVEAMILKNRNGDIKLVQVKHGRGKITVTGRPRFLLSSNLNRAPNSRLALALFGGNAAPNFAADGRITTASEGAWFFIRGTTRVRGLLGNLFTHGNLTVIIVSALVLLAAGFWAVIPVFGLVRGDNERPGKPLRERFLAEGRFLKRYGALELYRDRYITEIKRRLARKEGILGDDEILRRVEEICGKTERDSLMFARIFNGEPFTYREFPKVIVILKTILESI
jgi:hypothetical protein